MVTSMKNLLSSFILTFVAVLSLSAQQGGAPIYLMFTYDCVDQLEYRYAYKKDSMLVYSVHPRPDDRFLLKAGAGIRMANLPKGALSCRDFNMNELFVDAINSGARPVYMVHQTSSGYLLMQLTSATQITRYGSVYQVKAPRYGFAVDTNSLVYGTNLAAPNTNSAVYFNGIKIYNCLNEYTFRRTPGSGNDERSDFDFIPTLGLTNDKTGRTASEAENNYYRLSKVNGQALDDYLTGLCSSKPKPAPSSNVSVWANEMPPLPPAKGPVNPYDKESAVLGPPSPNANAVSPATEECSTPMGEGYHVVQRGQSLNLISKAYKIDINNLIKWNNIKDPNKVQACQVIWLKKPPANAATLVQNTKTVVPQPKPVDPYEHIRQDKKLANNPAPQNSGGGNGYVAPIVHNTTGSTGPKPEYVNPDPVAVPAPKKDETQPAFYHTVKSGESLGKISRFYGIPEACIRSYNNLPPTGPATIYVDQKLYISNCQQNADNRSNFLEQDKNDPVAKPVEEKVVPQPVKDPFEGQWQDTPVSGEGNNNTKGIELPTVEYFFEHVVQSGETLRSIALKYDMTVNELALLNNLSPTENVLPGKRLSIPRSKRKG